MHIFIVRTYQKHGYDKDFSCYDSPYNDVYVYNSVKHTTLLVSNEVFLYKYRKLDFVFIELASNSFFTFVMKWIWCVVNKTEANLASAKALAARCVRVIHAQCVLQFALLSRTLLRSSSNNEPSDPPYRIIFLYLFHTHFQWQTTMICWMERFTRTTSNSRISPKRKSNCSCVTCLFYIMVRHNR